MSGVVPRYKSGPPSYQVVEAVKGGQLVEARTGSKVGVAAAGSIKVLGVAGSDAQPQADQSGNTTSYGAPVTDVSVPQDYVAVHAGDCTIPVTYTTATAFGDLITCTGSGKVGKYTAGTTTYDAVIGRCVEPAGVSANTTGLARIF